MIALLTVEIPPFVIALAVALSILIYVCTGLMFFLALYSWNKSTRQHIAKFANRLSFCASRVTLSNLYENELANIKIKVQAKLRATYERSHHNRYIYWSQSRLYNNNNNNIDVVCSEELNCGSDNRSLEKKDFNYFPAKTCQAGEELLQIQHLHFERKPFVPNLVKEVVLHTSNDKKTTTHQNYDATDKSHVTNCYISVNKNDNNKITDLSVKSAVVSSANQISGDGNNNLANMDDTTNLFNWEGTENVSEFNYNYINEARPFLLPAITIPIVSSLNTTHTSSVQTNSNDHTNYVIDNNKQKEFTEIEVNINELRETSIAALQNEDSKVNNTFSADCIAISHDTSCTKLNSPRFASSPSASSLSASKTSAAVQNKLFEGSNMQRATTINLQDHSANTAASYSKGTCVSGLRDKHCNYNDLIFNNDNNEEKLEITSTAVITSDTNSLSNDEFSDHTTIDQKTCSSVEENEVVDEVKDTIHCLEQSQIKELCTVHACNTAQGQDNKFSINFNNNNINNNCKPYSRDQHILLKNSHSIASSYAIGANTGTNFNEAHVKELRVQAHERMGKTKSEDSIKMK